MSAPHAATIVSEGKVTHVLVPIEEYEQLILAAMAERGIARLDDKSTRWLSVDELALRLAGSRIAAARKKAGLTQQELAEKLNVGQSEISRIENNPDSSTVRTLRKVADALGVDVRALID